MRITRPSMKYIFRGSRLVHDFLYPTLRQALADVCARMEVKVCAQNCHRNGGARQSGQQRRLNIPMKKGSIARAVAGYRSNTTKVSRRLKQLSQIYPSGRIHRRELHHCRTTFEKNYRHISARQCRPVELPTMEAFHRWGLPWRNTWRVDPRGN